MCTCTCVHVNVLVDVRVDVHVNEWTHEWTCECTSGYTMASAWYTDRPTLSEPLKRLVWECFQRQWALGSGDASRTAAYCASAACRVGYAWGLCGIKVSILYALEHHAESLHDSKGHALQVLAFDTMVPRDTRCTKRSHLFGVCGGAFD